MSELVIEVERRQAKGSNASRRLRRRGLLPAVVYGGGKETVPIQIDRKKVLELLKTGGGENAVFLLKMAGTDQKRHTLVRDLQIDPVRHEVIHIDFLRILMTEKVRVRVPVELVGTAVGVKTEGGVLDFIHREAEIECLPGDIPPHLELDVSDLHTGQHLEAGQLELPAGVTLMDDPRRVLASVVHGKVVEAAAGEEAEEVLLETEMAEPEVIRRGKAEEEEDEEA